MSQNTSPMNHTASSAASLVSSSSPQQLPNELVPLGIGAVDAEKVQALPDRLVTEQPPPLDSADVEEGGDDVNDDEYISVDLRELRPNLECPICLGIIKKCRTIAECLHRFCKDCIEKAMRKGRNECPTCRIHCPSRRSLKEDPKFDTLISILIPDIEEFEEEEMPFLEEERIRNEQIMTAIAEIAKRQSKAMPKRHKHT